MHSIKNNIDIILRYYRFKLIAYLPEYLKFNPNIFFKTETNKTKVTLPTHKFNNFQLEKMNFSSIKSLFLPTLNTVIIFILVYLFFVYPLSGLIKHGVESFNKNRYVKIIYLDLIDNPLTFIRLAEVYFERGDMEEASLFIEYAKVTNTRYANNEIVINKIKKIEDLINKQ